MTLSKERINTIWADGERAKDWEVEDMAAELLERRERDKQEPAIHRYRRVSIEPYGPYPWHYEDFLKYPKPTEGIEDEYFYAEPPAPVVPEAIENAIEYIKSIAFHIDENDYHGQHIAHFMQQAIMWLEGDACRAAMHGSTISNSADFEIDEVIQHDAALNQTHVKQPARNSPVTPDGWVMVPIELTPRMITKLQQNTEIGSYIAANWAGAYGLFQKFWDEAIAAAQKQESE
ncbi:hypothetical protein C3369_07240 [Escherichia sp. ESNIH1]|nr:hypothetical protein C3369_07240 [Escherichia sp. ESNIH1]